MARWLDGWVGGGVGVGGGLRLLATQRPQTLDASSLPVAEVGGGDCPRRGHVQHRDGSHVAPGSLVVVLEAHTLGHRQTPVVTRRQRDVVVVHVVQRDVPLAVVHERLLEVRAACHRDGAVCQSSQSVVLGGRGVGGEGRELHFGRHRLCMCVMDVCITIHVKEWNNGYK